MRPIVQVAADPDRAAAAAARFVAAASRRAVRDRGRFRWVVAGGETPQGLYRRLASRYRSSVPWAEVEIFFGDERAVPPSDPESNYRMVADALLDRVPIPRRQVHPMPGRVRPLRKAAERYAHLLPRPGRRGSGTAPIFDLVLLGVGPDGHTASLFPGSAAVREGTRSVLAVPTAGRPPRVPRLTLTVPALSNAGAIAFLVTGAEKRPAVHQILRRWAYGDLRWPASLIGTDRPRYWFLDRAATPRGWHRPRGRGSSR